MHTFRYIFIALFLLLGNIFPGVLSAQESQTLSVTPPLFQLSALPGDIWQSSVKVVNGNPYPLTVYAEVVNFEAMGEAGQGRFVPLQRDDVDKTELGSWIQIAKGPHLVPREQTKEITFFVEVPDNAPPGGHYAAILVSTEPPEDTGELLAVKTSQAVTSLFFVRIEGDVNEAGAIREFRVVDKFLPKPEATFKLRFENKGNVHLQPRGDIVITNMWGTERGTIPVNYQTHFGNVLPMSIREFNFTWQSNFRMSDVGRYKAVATLGYGEDGVKSVTSVAYFWVIPVKATLIVLSVLSIFVGLIVWMIKLYIRRMLTLAGVDIQEEVQTKAPQKLSYKKVAAPLKSGVLDLRERLSDTDEAQSMLRTVGNFILQYKRFFISVVLLVIIFVTSVHFIGKATEKDQDYRVIIEPETSTHTEE